MENYKKVMGVMIAFIMLLSLFGCGSNQVVADYGNAEAFEAALNNGENLEGKVVSFTAGEVHPDSALGYNVWAGEHLNFISSRNPDIKEGDTVTVRTTTIESSLGSWLISYEKVNNVVINESTITSVPSNSTEVSSEPETMSETDNSVDMSDTIAEVVSEVVETPTELTIEYVSMDAKAFKDYFGSPCLSAYVAVKNNNDVPITFNNLSLDFEDDNGTLIGTDTMAKCIPDALKPGQVGYIYTYYYDLNGVSLDNGFHLQPNGEIVQANNFFEIEVSDVSAKTGDFLDVSVIGRGTNNTGKEQSLAEPGAVFFDADGNVVGFCYGLETFPDGQTTTFEISGDMMSEDMSPSIVDHVEVYIQGNSWF